MNRNEKYVMQTRLANLTLDWLCFAETAKVFKNIVSY